MRWHLSDFFGHYFSRPFETTDGRLSPLKAVVIVSAVSIALWVLIVDLVMRAL